MINLKLVTGANDRYIFTLLDFINSLNKMKFKMNNLIVYNYGFNEDNLNKLIILKNKYDFILENFDFSKYPDYVNLNKYKYIYCSYAFKPITIFLESEKNDGDYILWADCANRFSKDSLFKIVNELDKQYFYSPISSKPNTINSLELHHPTCLKYFNLESEREKIPQRSSGNVGFKNNSIGKYIIQEWYKHALIKDAIYPEGSSRNNHRQDQSVLTMIMYLYEKEKQIKFVDSDFGVRYWFKKDNNNSKQTATNIDLLLPFKLIDKGSSEQLATIYCENIEQALEIYINRKKYYLNEKQFHEKFIVK